MLLNIVHNWFVNRLAALMWTLCVAVGVVAGLVFVVALAQALGA